MNFPNQRLMTFLTFSGNAEKAMNYYCQVFGAKIESIIYFEDSELGDVGKVMNGVMDFDGTKLLFMDMAVQYPVPAHSWASSLLLSYTDEASFDAAFSAISSDGNVMMGPEAVGNIRKCCWVTDKYDVTWQLMWA